MPRLETAGGGPAKQFGPFAIFKDNRDRDRRFRRRKAGDVLLHAVFVDRKILFFKSGNDLSCLFVNDDRVNVDRIRFDRDDAGFRRGFFLFLFPLLFLGFFFQFLLGFRGGPLVLLLVAAASRRPLRLGLRNEASRANRKENYNN